MEYQIEFSGSPQFFKKALTAYWIRNNWKGYSFYVAVPSITFALCFTDSEIISSQTGDLVMGFMAGIVAILVFLFIYQLSCFQRVSPDEKGLDIIYRIDNKGISYQTDIITSNYKWKAFKKLLQSPNGWMLIIGSDRMLVISAELLDNELREFITHKIIEVKGKVVR